MRRLILIGKWFKEKRSTIVDLQAYRELKDNKEKKGGRHGSVPQSTKKDE